MTRTDKVTNLVAVVLPFLGFIVAVVLLWNKAVDWIDLALFAVFYLASGLGVTVGWHRLLTHRAFQSPKWLETTFAALGTLSVQGPVITWVADHRKHHAHTDEEGDPHSPHVGGGKGLRGLWHAHAGWLMKTHGSAQKRKYARDLMEEPGIRRVHRAFVPIVLFSLFAPGVIGAVLHDNPLTGFLHGYLWGGLVRIFLQHHVTWSINSICHYLGTRRFSVDDESRNVFWLALPSFGESWHHNHHAFPRSAEHGMKWYELDPSAWVIRGLKKVGLAHNVVYITPERQAEKLAGAAPAAAVDPAVEEEKVPAGVV